MCTALGVVEEVDAVLHLVLNVFGADDGPRDLVADRMVVLRDGLKALSLAF